METLRNYMWRHSYEKVSASSESDQTAEAAPRPRRPRFISPERLLIGLLLVSNVVFLVCLAAKDSKPYIDGYKTRGLNDDAKRFFAYSPLLDQYDLKPKMQTQNGVLRDNSSIWRQPPSPEVDAAWDYISTEGLELLTVTESDVIRSGKDPSMSLKAPSSWGEGEDAYIAQVEVFHQIHCLDELRKEMHYDYYYKSPPSELHRNHKAHCLHMILQSLMCAADVGIITHNWVHNENIEEPKTRLMPDFNMVKKCADFDGLLDWIREKKAVQNLALKWPDLRYIPGMKIVAGDGYA